jgi:hypothetical protein
MAMISDGQLVRAGPTKDAGDQHSQNSRQKDAIEGSGPTN